MSMYYLHRGGETTGPYGAGRLAQMLDAGEISGDDQACAVGTEEWIPVEMAAIAVTGPSLGVPKPRAEYAKRVRKLPYQGLSLLAIVIGIVMIAKGAFLLGNGLFLAGWVVVLVGLLINRRRYVCGKCGNRIEKTSQMCPACRVRIIK